MKKTALIATIVIVGGFALGVARTTWKEYITQLEERFPDLDPQIIRKAYRKMLMKSFTGKLAASDINDEQMDAIFLALIKEEIQSK